MKSFFPKLIIKKFRLIVEFSILLHGMSMAQNPAFVVSGKSGRFFFAMSGSGNGKCCQIKDSGEFEDIWKLKGEYMSRDELILSSNGKYLVNIPEVIAGTNADAMNEAAVIVYKNGELRKKFKLKDLLDGSKSLVRPLISREIVCFLGEHGFIGGDELVKIVGQKTPKGVELRSNDRWREFFWMKTLDGNTLLIDLEFSKVVMNERTELDVVSDKEAFEGRDPSSNSDD